MDNAPPVGLSDEEELRRYVNAMREAQGLGEFVTDDELRDEYRELFEPDSTAG